MYSNKQKEVPFLSIKYYEGAYTQAFIRSREKLIKLTPEEISKVSLCEFDHDKGFFSIRSFNHDIEVYYPSGEVLFANSSQSPSISWGLILLNYLSSAKDIPLSSKWVSYRQLPNGDVFFPAIKTNVLENLSKYFFNTKREILRKKLVQLGFETIKNPRADIVAIGQFAPKVPVMVQFWDGEEGIPSSFQILFDKTAYLHMHMEDLAALCGTIRDLLIKQSFPRF